MYVLASHGHYAEATLASCKFIVGEVPDFTTVSFQDPMGIDDLMTAYETAFAEEIEPKRFIILTDIPNGSPANAALQFKQLHPMIRVYSGLSLGLVLALATGTPIEEALVQSKDIIKELSLQDERATTLDAIDAVSTTTDTATDNPLINIRIDARLIHGQVATMWTRTLNATRIMVVDDQIVQSDIQKMTLKTAAPRGIHLSILTSAGAAKRILAGQYQGQRVFLIVRDPKALQEMVTAGVKFESVNVGNLSMSAGARQVTKSVAVTPENKAIFESLVNHGVSLYHQMVPNDPKVDFMPLLIKGE